MYAVLAVLALVLGIAGICFGSYVSANNKAVRYEANISKFHQASQNTLSAYTLKIKEMVQVPDMYVEDLKSVIKETFAGRYGKDGSKAMFQFIKENNLQFDSSLYTNIQAAMEAGRDEFRLAQDKKIDVCNDYKAAQGYFWSGMWMEIANYPKMDEAICNIVLDTKTSEAFNTGLATPISLK